MYILPVIESRSGGDGKKLATLLLTYFKESPRKMLWVVLWATTKEVESTRMFLMYYMVRNLIENIASNETLFRESNVQTELMFGYFYTERGKRFLDSLLRPLINFILRHPPVYLLIILLTYPPLIMFNNV